ncbi:hypothetical protein MTO96_018911 [Rhipicephalus appendiculatus]
MLMGHTVSREGSPCNSGRMHRHTAPGVQVAARGSAHHREVTRSRQMHAKPRVTRDNEGPTRCRKASSAPSRSAPSTGRLANIALCASHLSHREQPEHGSEKRSDKRRFRRARTTVVLGENFAKSAHQQQREGGGGGAPHHFLRVAREDCRKDAVWRKWPRGLPRSSASENCAPPPRRRLAAAYPGHSSPRQQAHTSARNGPEGPPLPRPRLEPSKGCPHDRHPEDVCFYEARKELSDDPLLLVEPFRWPTVSLTD